MILSKLLMVVLLVLVTSGTAYEKVHRRGPVVITQTLKQIASGTASWYGGAAFDGEHTSNMETFSSRKHTCAMLGRPLGQMLRIYNTENHRWSWCWLNDHGPYVSSRVIDVSPPVRDDLHFTGLANVRVYVWTRHEQLNKERSPHRAAVTAHSIKAPHHAQ